MDGETVHGLMRLAELLGASGLTGVLFWFIYWRNKGKQDQGVGASVRANAGDISALLAENKELKERVDALERRIIELDAREKLLLALFEKRTEKRTDEV